MGIDITAKQRARDPNADVYFLRDMHMAEPYPPVSNLPAEAELIEQGLGCELPMSNLT